MNLQNYYYKVNKAGRIQLVRECDVYEGHFPGRPVCPGVFNLQTIKECVSRELGRPLRITAIKQCRLTALATPENCPELSLDLNIMPETDYLIQARLYSPEQVYMELKCTMQSL